MTSEIKQTELKTNTDAVIIETRSVSNTLMEATFIMTKDTVNGIACYALNGKHMDNPVEVLAKGSKLTERQAKHMGFEWPHFMNYRK